MVSFLIINLLPCSGKVYSVPKAVIFLHYGPENQQKMDFLQQLPAGAFVLSSLYGHFVTEMKWCLTVFCAVTAK